MHDLPGEFNRELTRAVDHAMRDTEQELLRLSSGDFSTDELAAMDHPYATRHGSPLLDPVVINEQEGIFRAAWNRSSTISGGGDISSAIENTSDRADYLKNGNEFTFPRPIEEAGEAYAQEELEKRVGEAVDRFSSRDFTYE